MTVGSALRKQWTAMLTSRVWAKTMERGLPGTHRGQFAVLDSPGKLYKVRPPGSKTVAPKLNDVIALYTNAVQDYFADAHNGHTFILMFDADTPIGKYVTPKSHVIPTPLSDRHNGDHRKAWEDHFREFISTSNTNLDYMLNYIAQPTDTSPSVFNYTIPDEWNSILGNRAFKEYVSWLICNAVFHFTRVPEGRQLIVIGPDYAKQRVGNRIVELEEKFKFEKYEVDFAITYLAKLFPGDDCVVFSIDGDVMINLAYTRASQAKPTNPLEFESNVFIVTKQDSRKPGCEYIDVNEFWLAAFNYMNDIRTPQGLTVLHPVQTFCTLCILCCNHDYVENFPRVGPVNLFKGFIATVKQGVTRFIFSPDSESSLRLDAAAYFKLMLNSYRCVYPNINYPKTTNADQLLNAIHPYLRKTNADAAEKLTVTFVRNVLANLSWTLHYIVTSSQGVAHEPGTQIDSTGAPKYGFAASYHLSSHATYNTWRPDNTSLAHLRNPF